MQFNAAAPVPAVLQPLHDQLMQTADQPGATGNSRLWPQLLKIQCHAAAPVLAVLQPLRHHLTEPHKEPSQQLRKPLLTAATAAAAAGPARVIVYPLVSRALLLARLQQRVWRSCTHQALLSLPAVAAAAAAARGLADALLLLL
jgi:hypothetical protein